jgi:type II secretory pathway predicted ATPase ExeA/septal ring-binding cell division protein DamX
MYLDHFGLKEPPFRITPDTDFFFQGANRGATLEALLYAITHDEGIVKVSGEVGSGKTMLCRVLMERLPATVETIYLANPSLSRDEILFAIGDELKLELEKGQTTRILRVLQEHLIRLFGEGRRVVVLIDEAHAMPDETLEEIRLLSNLESNRHKLLQIVLFGQPELDEHLDTAHMRQLKERITHSFRLDPLVRSDIENYVDFRMRAAGYRGPKVFTREAIKLIANASQGLTRRVNILSDKALLAAFADGTHAVTAAEVKRAVRDSEFHRARSGAQKIRIGAGALAAGLVLGWGTHVLLPAGQPHPVSGPAPSATGPTAGVNTAPVATAAQPTIVSDARSPNGSNPPAVETGATTAALATASPAQVVSTAASVKLTPRLPSAGVPDAQPIAPAVPDAGLGRPPIPPEHGDLVQERFKATQEWLRSAPGDHYAIQLATVNSGGLARLEEFLRTASKMVPAGELFVYSVKIDGQQHYRAAYGSYASPAQALAAINGLPPLFSAYHPYYRSVERMRSQNRQ